jgi:hypothetical protein
LLKEVVGKEVMASMPQLDAPQVPKALEVPQTVIDINNSNKISDTGLCNHSLVLFEQQ